MSLSIHALKEARLVAARLASRFRLAAAVITPTSFSSPGRIGLVLVGIGQFPMSRDGVYHGDDFVHAGNGKACEA